MLYKNKKEYYNNNNLFYIKIKKNINIKIYAI